MYFYRTEIGMFISNYEAKLDKEGVKYRIPYPVEVVYQVDSQLAQAILSCVKANCDEVFIKSCETFKLD